VLWTEWAGRLVSLQIHPSDAVRKMKRIEIIDRKVPGQKDMFAPVLSGVPGQMTRCPCGFGAYEVKWQHNKGEVAEIT